MILSTSTADSGPVFIVMQYFDTGSGTANIICKASTAVVVGMHACMHACTLICLLAVTSEKISSADLLEYWKPPGMPPGIPPGIPPAPGGGIPPFFRPSSPNWSYTLRFSASFRISYASETSLNFSVAAALSPFALSYERHTCMFEAIP